MAMHFFAQFYVYCNGWHKYYEHIGCLKLAFTSIDTILFFKISNLCAMKSWEVTLPVFIQHIPLTISNDCTVYAWAMFVITYAVHTYVRLNTKLTLSCVHVLKTFSAAVSCRFVAKCHDVPSNLVTIYTHI